MTRFQDRMAWFSQLLRIQGTELWSTWRLRWKCRLIGVELGQEVRAAGPVMIRRCPGSNIRIEDRVCLVSSSFRCTASTLYAPVRFVTYLPAARIIIGAGSGLNGTSIVARSTTIRLGENVMIAPNVTIVDSDFHALWPPHNRVMNPPQGTDAAVTIGNCVWIGMQTIILKGVTIGENSVIGAGSLVSRDIPPNVVAAGNPARPIKDLPPDDFISKEQIES